jgi:hypothetical protein
LIWFLTPGANSIFYSNIRCFAPEILGASAENAEFSADAGDGRR